MKSIFTIALLLISAGIAAQNKIDSTVLWLDLNTTSVEEFVEMLPIKAYNQSDIFILTIGTEAEIGWVKESDIESLMELIKCKKKAYCIMKAISSQLPIGETSTVGGIAMDLIDSFRNRTEYPLGLTTCTGHNKNRVKEIQIWYNEFKKKTGANTM
jgi:hypothetical protein